jgi:hypothetical protein
VFANLTHWQWVTIAWLELFIAYGAYLGYLAWRQRQARRAGGKG